MDLFSVSPCDAREGGRRNWAARPPANVPGEWLRDSGPGAAAVLRSVPPGFTQRGAGNDGLRSQHPRLAERGDLLPRLRWVQLSAPDHHHLAGHGDHLHGLFIKTDAAETIPSVIANQSRHTRTNSQRELRRENSGGHMCTEAETQTSSTSVKVWGMNEWQDGGNRFLALYLTLFPPSCHSFSVLV